MPNYPFQPEILDALPEELAELFRALELKLLEEICSRLNIADQLNEVTVQDIRALRAHGIGLEDIKKAIAKTTDTGMDHLEQLLDDVVERNQAYYTELVDLAGVTAPERMVDQEDMWAIYEQTKGTYRNITQSMGFLVRQGRHRVMLPSAKAYQWALDSALLQVQSGAVSYDQAIREAVRELAEGGLKTVSYESGHVDNVDVAVRRATMTGVNQLNQKYREQSMDYLETDLVEVTAHSGARDVDGPNGWENHKRWQGKVYRWKSKPRTSQGRYPDFERVCGYGSVTGIGGANCRHSYWPFIEGVSERTYTDKELENIDPPPVEFEGRRYTAYEATQKQRQIERTIRKQKRLKTAFQEAGLKEDAQAANIRLRRLNEKYRQFSKAAGLPEQRERMRLSYVDDASRASAAKRLAKRAESGGVFYGQSAGNGSSGQPGNPVQIGTVDFSDKRAVMDQIDAAQAETEALDYEVNRTVTADGKVWRVVGEAGEVHPESIPSSLTGSYSYHNHPAAQTWFSFSADDGRFFFERGQTYSRASDYLYEYIMERTLDTIAVSPEMVYHRFNEIYWSDAMRLAADEVIDADMDAYHEVMLRLSKEYRFHYERRKRIGN